jgi:hypothetical protein
MAAAQRRPGAVVFADNRRRDQMEAVLTVTLASVWLLIPIVLTLLVLGVWKLVKFLWALSA